MKKIVERVKQIILSPRETWETIKTEETTVTGLFKEYLLLLAAIPAGAMFLGNWIVGFWVPKGTPWLVPIFSKAIRFSFGKSLSSAILWYLLTIAGIWLVGMIISYIAPRFGSSHDDVKGFKVAVYTFTPFLAVGILFLIPTLQIVAALAGLYGIYLMYIGLPIVMETPKEKSLAYFITIAVAIILISLIIGAIQTLIFGSFST